ncbi:MAG: bifunctional 5,10-methylenetetrahydrofolate dehydrogenase/5,10-methenyltetrahydrofolate cyclohydrolase, partial [Clostridiales bacterium]
MANILLGKPVVESMFLKLAQRCEDLKNNGGENPPKLGMIRVGNKSDDLYYEKTIKKFAADVGVECEVFIFPWDITKDELLLSIKSIGERGDIHGILPFLPFPLPDYKSWEAEIKESIPMGKDVDCLSPQSVAALYVGENSVFAPSMPQAVMEVLKFYDIALSGKSVVIVGRSLLVGKPLTFLMLNENATVTVCHSKTENMPRVVQGADIVIASLNMPNFLTAEYFCENQIVIDVGINKTEEGFCGDVDCAAVKKIVGAISPVPGGIGNVTTAVLLQN